MNVALLISIDTQLVQALSSLIERTPNWSLRVFDNVDAAWVAIYKNGIKLVVFDLDFTTTHAQPYYERHDALMTEGRMPATVVVSSERLASEHGKRAMRMHAMDYIRKPCDLDRIVFAMNIAQGPTP